MNMEETNNGSAAPVVPAQPEPVVDAPQAPAPAAPVQPLSTDASERTRQQFEKLLESNKQLFESNQNIQKQLEAQRVTSVKPVESVNEEDFIEIDPISGDRLINEKRLRAKIEEVNSKASEVDKLKQTVEGMQKSTENREIERQEKETFTAYPELNPRGKSYDSNFNKLVRATLTDSFYAQDDYGGKPLTFKEAADAVKAAYPTQPVQPAGATQPTAEELKAAEAASKEAQAGKEQSSAQPVSQPSAQVKQEASDEETLKNLVYRTRYLNDDAALAERIMHTEHILPKGDSGS